MLKIINERYVFIRLTLFYNFFKSMFSLLQTFDFVQNIFFTK